MADATLARQAEVSGRNGTCCWRVRIRRVAGAGGCRTARRGCVMGLHTKFEAIFGVSAEASASAPGRVNLLGDHTDYNGGFVLPTIIPQQTTVEIGIGVAEDEFYSATFNQHVRFPRSGSLSGFARYVSGCVRVLEQAGFALPPLRMAIQTDVPIGAGLSSSAALEIATLRALNTYFGFGLDPVRLAQFAQSAEVQYGGVSCGIMDQMACSLGRSDRMFFLDVRSLESRMV